MALCLLGKCSTHELYLSPFWIKAIIIIVCITCVYMCVSMWVICATAGMFVWSQRITLQSGVFPSAITWWLSVLLLSEDTSENLSGNGFILAHSFWGCTVSSSGQGSWEGQAMRLAHTLQLAVLKQRENRKWGAGYTTLKFTPSAKSKVTPLMGQWPPSTLPPARDQVFKDMSSRRTFLPSNHNT